MTTRIQLRRGTAAEWAAANPILSDGEAGYERDTKIYKVVDGCNLGPNLLTGNATADQVIDATATNIKQVTLA